MLYAMVVINMQNPNALVAMAHVSLNADNPYTVFAEFFKYCICTNASDSMMISEAIDAVNTEFGLFVPHHIAMKCLSQLVHDEIISINGHEILRIGTFDTEGFDERRRKYKETESALINELIRYVADYGREWAPDYARDQLIEVLDKNHLAYDIFCHENDAALVDISDTDELNEDEIASADEESNENDTGKDQPLFRDSLLVGKFVQSLLGSNTVGEEYLKRICEGLMVCVGAYQLSHPNGDDAPPSIAGTAFFFDTRLLLRLLGCAGAAAVSATKELVKLIQDGGGLIYYYPHTQEEVTRAFDDAIRALENNRPPRDHEMQQYAMSIRNSVAIVRAKRASLVSELAKQNIHLRRLNDYSDADRMRFGFDYDDLCKFMLSKLKWDIRTTENDARSLWETHMRRQGDYSEYCGTSKKLCVFVTSNPRLVEIALAYRSARKQTRNIQSWQSNRLPVITDARLTCRLWEPAAQGERLSLLYLTANAVAAQCPTKKYYNRMRELVESLGQQAPEYAGIHLPAYFDDNVTDAVLKNTKGQEENLNISTLASTIEELAEWKAKEQEEITNQERTEREEVSAKYNAQTKSIIDGAVREAKGKMGLAGVVLKVCLWLPTILAVVAGLISWVVALSVNSLGVRKATIIALIVLIVTQIISSKFFAKGIINCVLPWAEKHFTKRIRGSLRQAEEPYAETIIESTLEQTDLITKCKALSGRK